MAKTDKPKEAIDHPDHYQATGVECIDIIEALGLGFCLGNALKYVWRAGRKDNQKTIEDLKKAQWYLARHIQQLEGGQDG